MRFIDITCKGCNNSCPLHLLVENKKLISISGNCCHRGIVSANSQFQAMVGTDAQTSSGIKKLTCTGCSNRCELEVTVKDGVIESLSGEGCRRGIVSAKKQLRID